MTTKTLIAVAVVVAGAGLASALVITDAHKKREATIPAGLPIVGVLQKTVSTESSGPGDSFELRTVEPLRLNADTVIPANVVIRGDVAAAKGGGRISGAPELALRFTSLEIEGKSYPITANAMRFSGHSDGKESAAEIGGGTIAGGILGGVLGGGSGAVKGAVAGAAVGTGVAVATKGDQLVLPAGQKLKVRLAQPLVVEYTPEESAKKVGA